MRYTKFTASRIALAAAMAVGAVVAFEAPAFAEVEVLVNVSKTKTIDIDVTITKHKRLTIETATTIIFDGHGGAAEAQALVNVLNTNNFVDLDGVQYKADISGAVGTESIAFNTGVTQVNQAVGNMQNQGNVVAAGLAATGDVFVNAQAEVEQENIDGPEGGLNIQNSSFTSSMSFAVIGNIGVTQVNQDSGNMNNQTNAVAAAAGIETGDPNNPNAVVAALSEAALGQTNADHNINLSGNTSSATMTNSVLNNQGITHVNQSSGNYANQANVAAVGAATAQF